MITFSIRKSIKPERLLHNQRVLADADSLYSDELCDQFFGTKLHTDTCAIV